MVELYRSDLSGDEAKVRISGGLKKEEKPSNIIYHATRPGKSRPIIQGVQTSLGVTGERTGRGGGSKCEWIRHREVRKGKIELTFTVKATQRGKSVWKCGKELGAKEKPS